MNRATKTARVLVQVPAWIAWIGLVMAIPTYALVIHLADDRSPVSDDEGFRTLRTMLGFVAFVQALVVLLVRFVAMRAVYRWKRWLSLQGWGGLTVWLIATFVLMSLAQSVAIYGLTLFFQSGNFRDFYGFASAGMVLTVLMIPLWRDLDSAEPPAEIAAGHG